MSPACLPIAVRSCALTGSLCVPSPCAISAPSNGSPSIAPRIFTSPRVPNSSTTSSITTHVQAPGLSPFASWASNSLNMTRRLSHRGLAVVRFPGHRDVRRQAQSPCLIHVEDLAPERGQRDGDEFEVGEPERNADDRQTHEHSGGQVSDCQPPAGKQKPDDV